MDVLSVRQGVLGVVLKTKEETMKRETLRKFAIVLTLMVACALIVPTAMADTVYNLTVDHCTGGCNPGAPGTSMGTVTLHQVASGQVLVTINLVSPLYFVNTGIQNTIDFNLSGITTGVTATNFSNTHFSLDSGTAGTYHFDGFGDFGFSIVMDTAQGAGGAINASPLSFLVSATGLTEASFIGNAGGTIFGVDVYNTVNGNTGPIGTGGGTPPVPEPTSMALLGTGLVSLAGAIRRKLRS